jgi:hypothetical protein
MDRASAEQLATRLNSEHPERETHMWLARERDDEWSVVKAALPIGAKRDPLSTSIEQPDTIDHWPYQPDGGGRGT